jgi:hypothetical protein
VRGWLLVVGALAGCRGFFDTPPVTPDAPPAPDAAPIPVAYVQSAASSVTASTSVTIGLPLTQQGGDANVLIVGWAGGSLVSIADANHNAYTSATGVMQAADGWNQQIYLATNIGGASNTINVSFDSQVYAHVGVVEYMGIAGIDATAGAVGTANDRPESNSVTTTHAHDLLVAALSAQNAINTTSVAQNFTSRLSGSEYLSADSEVTSTGAYGATCIAVTQGDWVMQLLALRAR